MLAEAEPKPRRRRNESACGAPVARSMAWVGPNGYAHQTFVLNQELGRQYKGRHLNLLRKTLHVTRCSVPIDLVNS